MIYTIIADLEKLVLLKHTTIISENKRVVWYIGRFFLKFFQLFIFLSGHGEFLLQISHILSGFQPLVEAAR